MKLPDCVRQAHERHRPAVAVPLQFDEEELESAKEFAKERPYGPGAVHVIESPIPGQLELAQKYFDQLLAIPDAFDSNGRLNVRNQKAIILYEMAVSAYTYAQFPIYWSYSDERTPNTDRSDNQNLD